MQTYCKHDVLKVPILILSFQFMTAAPHANSPKQNTQGVEVLRMLSQTYSASYHVSITAMSNRTVLLQGFK